VPSAADDNDYQYPRGGRGSRGYDRDGGARGGYDRDGGARGGYDRDGARGYDRDGARGYDRDGGARGYDRNGGARGGYDRGGRGSRGRDRGATRAPPGFSDYSEGRRARGGGSSVSSVSSDRQQWPELPGVAPVSAAGGELGVSPAGAHQYPPVAAGTTRQCPPAPAGTTHQYQEGEMCLTKHEGELRLTRVICRGDNSCVVNLVDYGELYQEVYVADMRPLGYEGPGSVAAADSSGADQEEVECPDQEQEECHSLFSHSQRGSGGGATAATYRDDPAATYRDYAPATYREDGQRHDNDPPRRGGQRGGRSSQGGHQGPRGRGGDYPHRGGRGRGYHGGPRGEYDRRDDQKSYRGNASEELVDGRRVQERRVGAEGGTPDSHPKARGHQSDDADHRENRESYQDHRGNSRGGRGSNSGYQNGERVDQNRGNRNNERDDRDRDRDRQDNDSYDRNRARSYLGRERDDRGYNRNKEGSNSRPTTSAEDFVEGRRARQRRERAESGASDRAQGAMDCLDRAGSFRGDSFRGGSFRGCYMDREDEVARSQKSGVQGEDRDNRSGGRDYRGGGRGSRGRGYQEGDFRGRGRGYQGPERGYQGPGRGGPGGGRHQPPPGFDDEPFTGTLTFRRRGGRPPIASSGGSRGS